MGKVHSGSVQKLLVEDKDSRTLMEHVTQQSVQQAIFENIHQKWFYLAEAAPVCNGRQCRLFGYNAITITVKHVLEGTFPYPEDFDQATRKICKECTQIWLVVPKDSLNLSITQHDWRRQ